LINYLLLYITVKGAVLKHSMSFLVLVDPLSIIIPKNINVIYDFHMVYSF